MHGIRFLITFGLLYYFHVRVTSGLTITGLAKVKAQRQRENIVKRKEIKNNAHTEAAIIDEEDGNTQVEKSKLKSGIITAQKKGVIPQNKNALGMQHQTTPETSKGNLNLDIKQEKNDFLENEKRHDILLPEDQSLGKADETMVVIDEEGDDTTHSDNVKENEDELEGYMIVLDNSISHNANEEKNNKSLKELSRTFNTMDRELKSILQTEKKRQENIGVEKNNIKKSDLKLPFSKNLYDDRDLQMLKGADLADIEKQLKTDGTESEFRTLIKEVKAKLSIPTKIARTNSSTDNKDVPPFHRSGAERKMIPNPDPLDRFNQEQTFPMIKEIENNPVRSKPRNPNIDSTIRKAALPLANPHPTTSIPIKGFPLFRRKNLKNYETMNVGSEDEISSSSRVARTEKSSVNEFQREKKAGVAGQENAVPQTEKPAQVTQTSTKVVIHPTTTITLGKQKLERNTTTTSTFKPTTVTVKMKVTRSPVITINYQPKTVPSTTLKMVTVKQPTRNNSSVSKETEKTPEKNTSIPLKITIVPDTHLPNDDDQNPPKKNKEQIIDPWKAQTMLEYINKDPLEVWIYVYKNLRMLGLNSTMLRNGLVNAGSIDRLKSAMKRALKGEDITLSIVGGSISAGGGLYKDRGNIDGLYYKGLADWWNKAITPLTGSTMVINNVAIGSIGTDYFSYCVKNHIVNETDLVLWELSGNDYNRYVSLPTKGAKPLERLTRMILQLPKQPALLYVNFFKGIDYKVSKTTCPNFEDQGEDIIAHYYKLPSLSWRSMVCEPLLQHQQLFTLRTLFSNDQYHPSLRAHAQMSLLLILHLRHVMRSVLKWAAEHDGTIPDFAENYLIPPPLFVGLEHPVPLCWTLITPDLKERIQNSLHVSVLQEGGFKLDYATNFPVRYDRVICWKAEQPGSELKLRFNIPPKQQSSAKEDKKSEVAITTHTRWFGNAEVWLDDRPESPPVIEEGRKGDTGRRTQVDVIARDVDAGDHILTIHSKSLGFCLAAIMVN